MEKAKSRARIQPKQAHQSKSLESTLARLEQRLERTESKVEYLEKKVKKVEAERDHFKGLYYQALDTIREQDKKIEQLTAKLDSAERQLAWFRRDKFGQSSEADEINQPTSRPLNTSKQKRKRGQQPGSVGHGRTKRDNLDEEDITLDVTNKCCSSCSKPFKLLPETDDSTIAEIETLLYQLKFHRQRYARQCKCDGPKIITAPPPPKLYPRTSIGNSLWVHLCVQKFLHGIPTNRILKDLALRGLGLAVGTVTGGFKIINELVDPLYEEIKNFCRGENYWHADETHWRVFNDNQGAKNSKKWWLWVVAGKQAVTYILDRSRSRRVPEEFFAGSIGILMTDRYSAYKSLPLSIRKAWCWVHVRRDFLKLFRLPKFKAWAKDWLLIISKLFILAHNRFALWSDNKNFGSHWNIACADLTQHALLIEKQWQEQLQMPMEKVQRTALLSLQRHWPGLTLFLDDPRIPLDNNKAERLLRPCVISRKNSYGSGAEWSGHLSAKFFSIIQTWLINGLDPQALLLDYFNACSLTPGKPPPSIDNFLPWKMDPLRKLEFRLPESYKRPA